MKDFVAKMPHLLALKQSLTTFMTIAEIVKSVVNNDDFLDSLEVQQRFLNGIDTDKPHPYVEQLIAQCAPFDKVIRLICLQSEVNGGLKPVVLTGYKRDIIHSYGFQEIVTLKNLEKAGLFRTTPKKWHRLAKDSLKLFSEGNEGVRINIDLEICCVHCSLFFWNLADSFQDQCSRIDQTIRILKANDECEKTEDRS